MTNTGHSFIIKTTRLIVAMFVLIAIRRAIAAEVKIKGAGSIASNRDGVIKGLCKPNKHGPLKLVEVAARDCKVFCTYQGTPEFVQTEYIRYLNVKKEEATMPDGMPCAFGAACNKDGKCFCKFCDTKNTIK
uniref:Putative salp15 n=1 Tax=Ixodes ricinus TaxID=34613 RepID=A0A0K8RI46_IXORI